MSKRKSQTTIDSFFLRRSPRKSNHQNSVASVTTATAVTVVKEAEEVIDGGSLAKSTKIEVAIDVDSCSSTISCVPETPPSLDEESNDSADNGPLMSVVTEIFKKTSSAGSSNAWDVWDDEHVRLPACKRCVYPAQESSSTSKNPEAGNKTPESSPSKKFVSKWELIKKAYSEPIKSTYELEDAILSYNHLNKYMNFETLHHLFNNEYKAAETRQFFSKVLPNIVSLALAIPELFNSPIPLLRKGQAHSVTLTRKQVACLLANAFLCTYPRRLDNYPSINFNGMFSLPRRRTTAALDDPVLLLKTEKLKFIVHYFTRIAVDGDKGSDGCITFARHCLSRMPKWGMFCQELLPCKVYTEGTIESGGIGMLQMDFANCFIGGGVLDEGSVQEEIRFLICPELIVSRLLVERIGDTEAILITGCESFSSYGGYGGSLTWSGDFRDPTPRDSLGRIDTRVVAADATHFGSYLQQFQPHYINRELTKALTAFYPIPSTGNESDNNHPTAVATGNWGCGVFGGDPRLKFLIQLLAASVAGRDLVYFTFSDPALQTDIERVYRFLCDRKVTVDKVYKLLLSYYSNVILVSPRNRRPGIELYQFIYQQFTP